MARVTHSATDRSGYGPATSWLLSLILFLSYFGRDGRYQGIITMSAGLLVLVLLGNGRTIVNRFPVTVVWIYLGWAAASIAWSGFLLDSVRQVGNLVMWTTVGLMLAIAGSLDEITAIWARASRTIMAVACVAAVLVLQGEPMRDGPFINKNHLGYAVAASLIPLVAATWHRSRSRTVGWMVLAVTLSIAVDSQTGVVLSIAVPASYSLAVMAQRRRFDRLSTVALAATLLILIFAMVNADTFLEAGASALGRTTELSGRDLIWPAVVDAAGQRPWLGTGLGGVWLQPDLEPTASITRTLPLFLRPAATHAHNGFLDAWLQMGLVGLAIFIAVILSATRRAVGILRSRQGVQAAMPIVVVLIAVIGNLTESRFYNDNAWLMLAMVASLPRSLTHRTISSRDSNPAALTTEMSGP